MLKAECGIAHGELPSFEATFSHTSSPGYQGMRASTGSPNSAARSSAALPANGPPTMFSTTPSSVASRSTAPRSARRTASRDSGVGMVTASTAGGAARSSVSSWKRCTPGGRSTSSWSRARQATGEAGGHEALPHAALAAQHRHHPPNGGEPIGDPAPLGHNLIDQPRAVGFGQLVVRADVEGHRRKDALYDAATLRRTILLQRSVMASGNAIFSLL